MSPDIVMQILLIANPILVLLAGVGSIILGKWMERRIFLIIGVLTCLATPVIIILEIMVTAR
jgi:hypothetical protein